MDREQKARVVDQPEPSGYRLEQAMAAYQAARTRLVDDDPELAGDETALAEMLGAKQEDVIAALEQFLRGARHAKAMADSAGDMIEEMQARKSRYQRRAEAMRGVSFAIMDAMGMKKHEMPDMTVSVRAGQPSVVITNEELIPDIYVRIERKIDRQTIASVLKNGGEVMGAELSNTPPSLTVRTR
jgi:Siphovirus Gp157